MNIEIKKDNAISELLEKHSAFFAFSSAQFEEKENKEYKYCNMGAGLVAPKEFAKTIKDGLSKITEDYIKDRIETMGIKKIIWYELSNHECQITGEYDDVINKLEDYPGIDRETIAAEWPEYWQHCVDNDYF